MDLFFLNVFLLIISLGEELEYVGGLGGARFGVGGVTRKTSVSSSLTQGVGSEVDDNEEMEMS
jgi:hypothetical protein